MMGTRRDIFLATCLLESIEDENYRFVSNFNLILIHSMSGIFCLLQKHKKIAD